MSHPRSSRPAKSSGVKFLRLPVSSVGSIAASMPPLFVPSAQWARSPVSGTAAPYEAVDLEPMNVLPLTFAVHDGAVPTPKTWPNSCIATEKKSFCPVDKPLVVAPKNHVDDV